MILHNVRIILHNTCTCISVVLHFVINDDTSVVHTRVQLYNNWTSDDLLQKLTGGLFSAHGCKKNQYKDKAIKKILVSKYSKTKISF